MDVACRSCQLPLKRRKKEDKAESHQAYQWRSPRAQSRRHPDPSALQRDCEAENFSKSDQGWTLWCVSGGCWSFSRFLTANLSTVSSSLLRTSRKPHLCTPRGGMLPVTRNWLEESCVHSRLGRCTSGMAYGFAGVGHRRRCGPIREAQRATVWCGRA